LREKLQLLNLSPPIGVDFAVVEKILIIIVVGVTHELCWKRKLRSHYHAAPIHYV
jgi:hypothetical protein